MAAGSVAAESVAAGSVAAGSVAAGSVAAAGGLKETREARFAETGRPTEPPCSLTPPPPCSLTPPPPCRFMLSTP